MVAAAKWPIPLHQTVHCGATMSMATVEVLLRPPAASMIAVQDMLG
jgi:hypothetical protein